MTARRASPEPRPSCRGGGGKQGVFRPGGATWADRLAWADHPQSAYRRQRARRCAEPGLDRRAGYRAALACGLALARREVIRAPGWLRLDALRYAARASRAPAPTIKIPGRLHGGLPINRLVAIRWSTAQQAGAAQPLVA